MTRFKSVVMVMALSFLFWFTHAGDRNTGCKVPNFSQLKIEKISCGEIGEMSKFIYGDSKSESPYFTKFDRGNVVVIRSVITSLIIEASGFRGSVSKNSISQTKLIKPPEEDQIATRSFLAKTIRKKNWFIVTERINYAVQGGQLGFVVDCSTAVRINKGDAVAIAECYPLEESKRFADLLKSGL